MKKIAIALLAVLLVVCSVGLIACSGAKVLDVYIFELEGQTVTEEFELPRTIGDQDAKWTSDSDLITITDRSKDDMDFLATITRPETDKTEVKLTVKVGGASKTFSVYVEPLNVYDFSSAYKFKQDKAMVTKDFDLDSKTTLEGKEATITWRVKDEYKNYIAVENGKCKVTPSSLDPQVRITAKFSYGGETTEKDYRMTVSIEKTELEAIDYWYNNTGVSVDIKGYVVSVGTAYSSSYNNINLYVADVDGRCGYYVYRVVLKNKEDGPKIKRGSYVEITGTTNTSYNGLIETNAGGQLVIDESKNKTEAEMKAMCYALDNDILGKVPEAIYHTSQYVSLTNWQIDKISDEVKASDGVDNKDLFVLKKNGVTVTVRTSKYLEDIYKDKTDKAFTDILALQSTLKKGDVISIKGILSNNKGYTILPIDATDVVKVGTTADTDETIKAMPGVKAGEFLTKAKTGFNAVISSNNLNLIVTKDKTVTLPANADGVEVKYSILGTSSAIKLEGNVLTIKDIAAHERIHLQVDLKVGDYTTTAFQYVEVWNKTDAEMIADEVLNLYMDEDVKLLAPSVTALKTEGSIYGANVQITWAVKDAATHAYATIDKNNNLVISETTLPDQKVTIVATVKVKDSSVAAGTKEFTFAVPQILVKVADPAADTAYQLVVSQNNTNHTLYATAKVNDSGYVVVTQDIKEASAIYVEKVTDGVKLYFKDGTTKKYLGAERAPGATQTDRFYSNLVIGEKVNTVWVMNDLCMKTTIKAHENESDKTKTYEVYMGTYSSNDRIALSETSYINADNAGVSQFPAFIAMASDINSVSAEVAATAALGSVSVATSITRPQSITLPTVANFKDATVEYSLKTTTAAVLADGKLTVSSLPKEETKITLTVTVKVGTVTKTKDVEITIVAAPRSIEVDVTKTYNIIMTVGSNKSYLVNEVASKYYIKGDATAANASVVKAEKVDG
ncbi:MAG: hypothetical protein NC183_06845, partial [Corallococcus sp.]|nr:hypothetical protein [Corallococcus sp.]